MGQLMRRHWMPACLSEEVAEPDGTPVRVRLFGEDLVVFRDTDGRVGVLDEYCPHRRASLVLGRNEECGLRCLYHGWKMDVDGNVLEMASEPPGSGIAEKVKHKAYPAREGGGFVWTYMGPPETMPEFEPPRLRADADSACAIVKIHVPCNWAQILEGAIDSAHSSSLHSSDMVPARVERAKATDSTWLRPSTDKAPRMQVRAHELRLPLRRDPPADQERRHARLRAHHGVRRAVHRADPAQQRLQRRQRQRADRTTPTPTFYFIAWSDGSKPGIDQEAWRKFTARSRASISTQTSATCARSTTTSGRTARR